jgi:hypothetical protein
LELLTPLTRAWSQRRLRQLLLAEEWGLAEPSLSRASSSLKLNFAGILSAVNAQPKTADLSCRLAAADLIDQALEPIGGFEDRADFAAVVEKAEDGHPSGPLARNALSPRGSSRLTGGMTM